MPFNPDLPLRALLLHLSAQADGRMPATQGVLAHGAFFALLASVDAGLAARLHASGERQPFTLSPLGDLPPPGADGYHRVRAGQRSWLRLTTLGDEPFAAFVRSALAAGGRMHLRLGDVPFAVDDVLGSPGSHPLVGYVRAGALVDQAHRDRCLRMVFATPMAMSMGRRDGIRQRMIVLPWPQYVFASLRGAWNRATGDGIPIEFESWVAETVVVRDVRHWQTAVFQIKRGPHPGGMGDVVFEALDDHPQYLQLLNVLADFAFFSGVGSKTTMGMGQVRCLTHATGEVGGEGRPASFTVQPAPA